MPAMIKIIMTNSEQKNQGAEKTVSSECNSKNAKEWKDCVEKDLDELNKRVTKLEGKISVYNLAISNPKIGDERSKILEDYKNVLSTSQNKINALIVRINEKVASFRYAGQKSVEDTEWWKIPALVVASLGGLLMLAAIPIVAIASATAGVITVVAGGLVFIGGAVAWAALKIKAEDMKEQNMTDENILKEKLANLKRHFDTAMSSQYPMQVQDEIKQPIENEQTVRRRV